MIWTLYPVIAQFTKFPCSRIFVILSHSIFGGIYIFEDRWQAIVPSVGEVFGGPLFDSFLSSPLSNRSG
jgi:hypothetical protein